MHPPMHCVALTGLKLSILWAQSPDGWHDRCVPACLLPSCLLEALLLGTYMLKISMFLRLIGFLSLWIHFISTGILYFYILFVCSVGFYFEKVPHYVTQAGLAFAMKRREENLRPVSHHV